MTGLRVHFLHRNMWDIVIIEEEVNPPHPRCPRCNILLLWEVLNGCHPNTTSCKKGGRIEEAQDGSHLRLPTATECYSEETVGGGG